MKKLALLTIILSVILCSCGGGSSKEDKASSESEKSEKDVILSSKEDIINKLKEFNINVPDSMTFVKIEESVTNRYKGNIAYAAKFKIENVDDATRSQLNDWHSKQFSDLIEDNWVKVDYRENVEMMGGGGMYSTFSLKKPKSGGNYYLLKLMLSYNSEKNTIKLTLSPGVSSSLVE